LSRFETPRSRKLHAVGNVDVEMHSERVEPRYASGARSHDAIVILDPDGFIATWNACAEGIYGYASKDIIGRHLSILFESNNDEHGRPQHLLETAALERTEDHTWHVRKDGARFWAHVVLTVQKNDRGQLLGFVCCSNDLSELKNGAEQRSDSEALQAILNNSQAAMFIKDSTGRYLHVNERLARDCGMPREAFLGRTDTEIFCADVSKSLQFNDTVVLTRGQALEFKQQRTLDGRCHTNLIFKFPVRDPSGRIVGVGGTVTDITAQLQGAQSAQNQSMRQKLIAAFGHFALQNPEFDELITEAAATVRKGLQPEFSRYLALTSGDETALQFKAGCGWSGAWAEQTTFDAVVETKDRFSIGARETALIQDYSLETRNRPSPIIKDHGIRSGAEVLVWGAHGPYGLLGVYSRAPGTFSQESVDFLRGIKNTLAAAIDRKRAEDRLAYLAQFDALTGLPNRTLYIERLWQALRQMDRGKHTLGVLFVDVDRFKSVNDKLGHSGGDQVLARVAARLEGCVRPTDTVSRLSGDEFALLLDYIAEPEDASMVAQRVIASLAEPFHVNGHEVYVSASLGISIAPNDGSNPDVLLKNADLAMYRAKRAGRNAYQFFVAEMNAQTAERLQTETELRGALERREFVLHYQPKADIATGLISGFEALLRWNHPKRGLVSPTEFVPILEDTGLICEVGEWVVRQACEQLRAWQIDGLAGRPIAVNLSALQFNHNDLDVSISRILQDTQIDPNLLEFEITESTLMSDSEEAVRVLGNMKKCGIRLSVDDFGTGYSSLAYLKRFPLDSLKIDRAFIRDITTDSGDATIARAIISLAQSLKLKVVAEGVETLAQLQFLRDHGCDEMQGYLFAQPMPAAECARALLEDWRLPEPR
jgi:diguanylate cyclase (GGDEF)-like protein/PAS domain S-box-containing protein